MIVGARASLSRLMAVGIVAASALMVTAAAAPADAADYTGNCSHNYVGYIDGGSTKYAAWASCSSLAGNTKARAQLVRDGGPDYFSSYFTRLNTRYYTGYWTCYLGCRSALQLAAR